MTENRVVALRQKGAIDDPLTEILRTGARRLIAQAVEAEFETFLTLDRGTCASGWPPTGGSSRA
jgi:putative transposase